MLRTFLSSNMNFPPRLPTLLRQAPEERKAPRQHVGEGGEELPEAIWILPLLLQRRPPLP